MEQLDKCKLLSKVELEVYGNKLLTREKDKIIVEVRMRLASSVSNSKKNIECGGQDVEL